MRVLVTGGAGFIGSHVVDRCIMMGYEVDALDDLSGGLQSNINPEVRHFFNNDIRDKEFVTGLFNAHRYDYVYHLAAYAAEGLSPYIREYNYDVNVLGSMNIINGCINGNVKRLVYVSSAAVYGHNGYDAMECDDPSPCDPYGLAKYTVERDLALAKDTFGLEYTIFRPFNVYGPRQNTMDKYRNVVGIFINAALNGEPLRVFGDGKQIRCFSYIDDVAPVIAESVKYPLSNIVINVGNPTPHTINELAEIVMSNIPGTTIEYIPARDEAKVVTPLVKDAQLKTFIGLQSGIRRTIDYIRSNPREEMPVYPNVEVMKNFPEGWKK